jgi:cell shape-determining protein MreC
VEERPSISVDNDFENLMRKAKKLKEVKEENRKLRKLLQYEVNLRRVQLDNTEKIREETQKTMSNLKDEFDALVKEMHRGGPHRPDFSARY